MRGKRIRENHHRLKKDAYRGFLVVAFTACVKNRERLFVEPTLVKSFEGILIESARVFDCDILAYVFMPDHMHVIFQGTSQQSDCLATMNRFKHRSGFWLYRNRKGVRWQKDYYDHIVRSEAEIGRQIGYVLENPLRAGLVADWKDYPFKGSTVYDLQNWVG